MITITRKETTLNIKASISVGAGWDIYFQHNRSTELDAVLLKEKMDKDLGDFMETIRRKAYEQGWKDKASRKTPKRDWFSRSTNPDFL